MRISLNVTNFSWPRDIAGELRGVVQAADEGGLDTVWVSDHLLQADPTSTPEAEMLEAYTMLGYLAGQTSRVRLGTMVTAATYRPPALLIKAVTTLDVLSGGRAWLGIGSGYSEGEAQAMGLPLPPVAERFERLEEILRLAMLMWSGSDAPFHGTHYRLERPLCNPRPVSRPHPGVLIGGMGEQKTLRLVARYADAANLFDVPDGGRTVRHKLDVLAAHCAAEGRPPEAIDKTLSSRYQPGESGADFAERCAAAAGLGITHVVAVTSGPWSEKSVAALAEAARIVRER